MSKFSKSVMKAAFFTKNGPPSVLEYANIDILPLKPREVRVSVKAASVNPIDLYIRSGLVNTPRNKQQIVGCDLAGEVCEIGS